MTINSTDQLAELSAATDDASEERDKPGEGASFPIVGVGASAGGLEAFTQLLKALPADTGMAFVLVQHLAPSHASALAEILSRATSMPVMEVRDELTVEPNHVYVIPPDRSMVIMRGVLQLLPREGRGAHHPVDQFFRALAAERRHQAIGVVLSGTATDGTLGLEEIKAEGGITFAQDATAQHEGMPHSAIASGCVDFVLPPDEIAREIVRIGQHPYAVPEGEARATEDKPNLAQVVLLLRHATGVDFTGYKFNTLYRRVTRRMVFQNMDGLAEYVQFLRRTPAELQSLYQDILINVTSFFRDPDSFEALKGQVFPRLLKDRSRHNPVRLWTVGCSTGQEAYSLAMAFAEAAEAAGSSVPCQLFASDLNAAGIEKARAGVYPKGIAQQVSPERLQRFFTEADGSYRIAKSIRDVCVFSRHNVLTDPPFSHIDMISCRNLLIYLEPVLQQRVMRTLHYALKPAGCLWLGVSETIGTYRNLFDAEDAKHKIYTKKAGSGPGHGHFPLQPGDAPRSPSPPITARSSESADLLNEADRVLSAKFAPPGVLVSADLDILQYRGDIGPYLAPTPGKASLSLLKMLREGLLVAVRAAVLRAGKEQAAVRHEGVRVQSNGGHREVAVEVIPLKGSGAKEGGFLILFEETEAVRRVDSTLRVPEASATDTDNARIEQELAATREYLQSVIEQQDAANEELQSANEEVQSANEELQSTNEELETSKEEIQSSNEELATVNDELNNRNTELNRLNNDLVNLLGSVQMPIIMLGPDLRIRRFTPSAEKLLNLIQTDVGRSLADIKLNLCGLDDLESLLAEVIDTVSVKERDVQDKHGHWYSLRVHPYRTLENKIDGLVVMLVDVDAMKRANDKVRESEERYRTLFDLGPVAIYSCDASGVIHEFNRRAAELWGRAPAPGDTDERFCGSFKLFRPDGSILLHEQSPMAEVLSGKIAAALDAEVLIERPEGSRVTVSVNIRPLKNERGEVTGAINCFYDITERNRAEAVVRGSNTRFEALFDASPIGMYLVDSKLRMRLVSRSARPVFGDVGEVIGRDFVEVIHIVWPPEVADDIVARFRHTLETGESYAAPEFSEERYDRKVREYYDWQIHRIALPDGQYGVVCYFVDVTERLRMSNELRRYAAELSESDRRKNEFLAMLAHELRNPLAPIRDALQVLRLTEGKGQDIQGASDMIEWQVGQLVRLVDDLLDVSRISRGKIELRRERIELASTVRHAVDAVQAHYDKLERELTITLSPQPIYLNADPTRLAQLVGNLLNNACKFTDKGGHIWLTVERQGAHAVIRVRDNGIGIAADQIAHIFEMFVQVDTSLERSVSGLGIGLTLVKAVAEMHNGTVEVQSGGLGQGSEFVVRLPILVETSKPSPPEPTVNEPTTMTARRILVVDDNRNAADWLAKLLQLTGNETKTAYDGLEAVQAAVTFRPNVVLLDIGLPRLNGYEVARNIREQPWGKKIIIVALTGWAQEEDRRKSSEAGFDGHMVKPVDHTALMNLLARLQPTNEPAR